MTSPFTRINESYSYYINIDFGRKIAEVRMNSITFLMRVEQSEKTSKFFRLISNEDPAINGSCGFQGRTICGKFTFNKQLYFFSGNNQPLNIRKQLTKVKRRPHQEMIDNSYTYTPQKPVS